MKWTTDPRRNLHATGLRGTYRIAPANGAWWLFGTLHDGLPMLALPVRGRPFERQEDAREFAQRLDRVKAVEPEVSGC